VAATLRRIAVLNRGDSATRCMRAIRELRTEEASELTGIALYTDPDRFAPFVLESDEALSLGPALRGQPGEQRVAYLDQERVLAALRALRADAVWPGWGFLAEDPSFVERVEALGLAFLGPRSETVRLLGDKLAAKRLAEACSVPVLPWSHDTIEREQLRKVALRIGFPLVLKAAAGGGGRGIRKVERVEDLDDAFAVAHKEALHAFGDGRIFAEACAMRARHIEVQIAADRHGQVLALGMRDCSVQRNHQKVVEEGPPPGLPTQIREQICEASIRLARKAGYVGVGTCEYLLAADGSFAFLEVNPRLQVEHGVTEMLTGLDLVKWQIRIARGEALPAQAPEERGHAIEVRVCAEDPSAGFAPSPGAVEYLELPAGPGIRVDCGLAVRGPIPSEFDSMVAKVIGYGATRAEARARLIRAVADLRVVVSGGMLNKGFLLDILAHPQFAQAEYHTQWLESSGIARDPAARIEAPLVAAILSYQRERAAVRSSFFAESSRGRPRQIPPSTGREIDLVYAGCSYRFRVYAISGFVYRVYLGERVVEVALHETGPQLLELTLGGRHSTVLYSESDGELRIEIDGRLHRVRGDMGGRVRAPAPALVIEVAVAPGDVVEAGQRLGLLEAMKTETAFFAPVAGTVREVCVRPSERVDAGNVLLVIEPSVAGAPGTGAACLLLPAEADPLDVLFDPDTGEPDLIAAARHSGAQRAAAIRALRAEARRILMGYDVSPERAERLMSVFEAPVHGVPDSFRSELVPLEHAVAMYGDIDLLFSRIPSGGDEDELGPSNDARMAMYLRRIEAEGAGIEPSFLDALRRALRHYDLPSLAPTPELERALLRVWATRTTLELRNRLIVSLLHLMLRLAEEGERFTRHSDFEGALARVAELRGTVPPGVADLAAQVRYLIFERPRTGRADPDAISQETLALTLVPPPDEAALARRAAQVGMSVEEARRIELWRLDNFDLERVETFAGVHTFYGRARDGSGDERLFCFSEVLDLGDQLPDAPDLPLFERRFHQAIEGLRSLQAIRDPSHRMRWNRLYVFVRPAVVLSSRLLRTTVRRLSPETGHLGLERVIVRLAAVDPERRDMTPRRVEVLSGNPTGSHVETTMRAPHAQPLAPATGYERRVATARARGLNYPYELIRLFTAAPDERPSGPAAALDAGDFQEYDVIDGAAQPVQRPPGGNTCGIVFGTIRTPTVKHPEGMRRVLILGDSTYGMGALAAPECDRIVAALALAERERIPIEWMTVSSGARIALDSGTENLDATARVVRKLVTFTDQGGEVNVIVAGVNVGAQSYFDALATMGLQSRGILVMLASSSMVLTGRAALEMSGAVTAEDDVGIGGYERIMGPTGQAQYQARNIADAYRILLEHYACSYRAPGEDAPRSFATRDPIQRDITQYPYEGDEGFERIGDLFSAAHNLDRKRPFAMRPVMRSLIDQDGGSLERWRDWVGAETAIVWDAHLGGVPITLIGVESRPLPRVGHVPNDGPDTWTAGTLFPQSSKKVARALNAASGVRPAVMLANLSGFDGSPESMRRGVLELGAEIARAVVRFRGPFLFTVVSRYHGGAYVVFSRELNDGMRVTALAGSFASVIGGSAAAAVVFPRDVRKRANDDPRVREAAARLSESPDAASRIARRAEYERILEQVRLEKQAQMGAEFDAVHSVERALKVGSIESILQPETLRPSLIAFLHETRSA
jgi:acetyl/propionyl-CoA carboxylase alpha subunit/acetyl-CoA carboxylase carboxyltransferase component